MSQVQLNDWGIGGRGVEKKRQEHNIHRALTTHKAFPSTLFNSHTIVRQFNCYSHCIDEE